MSGGSLQLYEYPADLVRLSREKCGRSGQYRKGKLIAVFGPDIPLPDLRVESSRLRAREKKDVRHVRGALPRADGIAQPHDGTARKF
jgi:hypothetical protein